MFIDKELICIQCTNPFIFKAGEQEFFSTKGLSNTPKRCENCRIYNRLNRAGKSTDVISKVTCEECRSEFVVPFRPLGYKPVYCNTCFKVRKSEEIRIIHFGVGV
ncbi:MAG: zinc-ribbon domain containing protein [Candidatus Obscuribacterales bacterium]|nr:zinc-ribbon domain containing protein [Candidatus Obscuribacterales bacterium]